MHDQTHETLLEGLLAGDIDPASPAVRAQLSACAECRASWEEMQRITRSLDELAHPAREVLADAADLRRTPGERDAEHALRREIAAGASKPRARPTRLLPVLLALAALVLVAFGIRSLIESAHRAERSDPLLGGTSHFELSPHGTVPRAQVFPLRWSPAVPPDAELRLTLQTRERESEAWEEIFSGTVAGDGRAWSPSEEVRERCHRLLRFRIQLSDANGAREKPSDWQAFSVSD